ncbi:hypothetical protein A2881_01395 [Candidatus Peribacteria bacterium RIFCSPHIGHO2_01_FULL_55_13]|nr:MAG: hypothetical protein A2881_01395 [Candidatus Peribacteria bacterium RIFCSPHIGHO2_01_FULL_55_13]OGJ64698.1 MAG: hypothetical protein A3F36_01680 [Candidatus Peribacteria bacterium RIFCSPHIGHO2_12_FULL_55_11]
MTSEEFITAVQSFSGLESAMIEELMQLSPTLTPEQRKRAAVQLTPLSAELGKLQKVWKGLTEDASAILQVCRHTFLPQIRQIEESVDHDAALKKAEASLITT